MSQKSVTDQIYEEFSNRLKNDDLFNGVAEELYELAKKGKASKTKIQEIMAKKDEDQKSGNHES
jgi:hypothetical protein